MVTDYDLMLDKVLTFVSVGLGIDKSKLTEQTLIEHDVGIAGLDTLTFYEEFFKEFGIVNPTDFNPDHYVTSEHLPIALIIKSIFSAKARLALATKNTSIKHLTNVALKGKWYEGSMSHDRSQNRSLCHATSELS